MTFEPHPRAFFRPDAPGDRICGAADKLRLLKESGVSSTFVVRFNRSLAGTSAGDFASALLDGLGVRRIAVGENFRFGKNRLGDCDLLRSECDKRGAEFVSLPLAKLNGVAVSSGRVRDALLRGDFAAAAELLGRAWTMRGRVVRGAGYGRRLGFPTANLFLPFSPPVRGVFAAWACIGDAGGDEAQSSGEWIPAAVSVGVNPSVAGCGGLKTEAHLPGFAGDLYGRRLTLRPVARLRDEAKYESEAALREAIAGDVSAALGMLSGAGSVS